jgi:hypothetical protein
MLAELGQRRLAPRLLALSGSKDHAPASGAKLRWITRYRAVLLIH